MSVVQPDCIPESAAAYPATGCVGLTDVSVDASFRLQKSVVRAATSSKATQNTVPIIRARPDLDGQFLSLKLTLDYIRRHTVGVEDWAPIMDYFIKRFCEELTLRVGEWSYGTYHDVLANVKVPGVTRDLLSNIHTLRPLVCVGFPTIVADMDYVVDVCDTQRDLFGVDDNPSNDSAYEVALSETNLSEVVSRCSRVRTSLNGTQSLLMHGVVRGKPNRVVGPAGLADFDLVRAASLSHMTYKCHEFDGTSVYSTKPCYMGDDLVLPPQYTTSQSIPRGRFKHHYLFSQRR